MMRRLLLASVLLAMGLTTGGCVFLVRHNEVRPVATHESTIVQAPLRAHLTDGSIVHFPSGARIDGEWLQGSGIAYDHRLEPIRTVSLVPLDSIIGVEAVHGDIDAVASLGASVLANVIAAVVVPALFVAIFGSCPTVYSALDGDFAGSSVILEAEAFSHSIAPLLEARTVHRLQAGPALDGRLTLEVRNEALETHFINHIELVSVAHPQGTLVYPTSRNALLALRHPLVPRGAIDRSGRDVTDVLATADGVAFASPVELLGNAREDDLLDWIDVEFDRPQSGATALILDYRDSLLGTVLFYENLLAWQGPRALDWMHRDLQTVSGLLELGNFYVERMGMRISIWDGSAYQAVERLPHVGPIAWSHTAVPLVIPAGDGPVRLRLTFPVDSWRIDRLALAEVVPDFHESTVPLLAARDAADRPLTEAGRLLGRVDDQYLTTLPGTRFTVIFEPDTAPADVSQTFFLALQGYYTEWMRPDWLRRASQDLKPTGTTLHAAMTSWREQRESFEKAFFDTKIPVRWVEETP